MEIDLEMAAEQRRGLIRRFPLEDWPELPLERYALGSTSALRWPAASGEATPGGCPATRRAACAATTVTSIGRARSSISRAVSTVTSSNAMGAMSCCRAVAVLHSVEK